MVSNGSYYVTHNNDFCDSHKSAPQQCMRRWGILQVTHLAEHKKAVNRIAVAGNGSFFATASNDETVKIWDCRRLEKDVTFRSRLTYSSQVKP